MVSLYALYVELPIYMYTQQTKESNMNDENNMKGRIPLLNRLINA